jgi:hypothetical protein
LTCDGAEELGDPVEDEADDGDFAGEGEAERDGGVDVAAADVGGHGDEDGEREAVRGGDDEEARGLHVAGGVELLVGHDGAHADEDEQEQRDELRQRALERVRAGRLIPLAQRHLHHDDRSSSSKTHSSSTATQSTLLLLLLLLLRPLPAMDRSLEEEGMCENVCEGALADTLIHRVSTQFGDFLGQKFLGN